MMDSRFIILFVFSVFITLYNFRGSQLPDITRIVGLATTLLTKVEMAAGESCW